MYDSDDQYCCESTEGLREKKGLEGDRGDVDGLSEIRQLFIVDTGSEHCYKSG